ncbi:unnamed protein product [Penicillium roqueforti FM164]|uniref:Genomic scaffold, ProqFM164S02 n=1 Tax=Penicillium roqueforti (strain FM164) TaxID=1365484 RepID=W6Q580_PENRF|nr:unnamed protein product [Penicillium roqueforti FM164]
MHTAPAKTQPQQALPTTTLALVDSPLLSTPPHESDHGRPNHDLTPIEKRGLVRGRMPAKAIMREEGMHGLAWRRWTGTRLGRSADQGREFSM